MTAGRVGQVDVDEQRANAAQRNEAGRVMPADAAEDTPGSTQSTVRESSTPARFRRRGSNVGGRKKLQSVPWVTVNQVDLRSTVAANANDD